jgi:hypothetical protein
LLHLCLSFAIKVPHVPFPYMAARCTYRGAYSSVV